MNLIAENDIINDSKDLVGILTRKCKSLVYKVAWPACSLARLKTFHYLIKRFEKTILYVESRSSRLSPQIRLGARLSFLCPSDKK